MGDFPFGGGLPALQLQASANDVALIDSTQTIVSWTAPNDGNVHWVFFAAGQDVTSATTGGLVQTSYTLPDGTGPITHTLFAASQADTGENEPSNTYGRPVEAGSTVSVIQATALSGGAAVVWAAIWGA